jgi:hypothetical protein
LLFAQKCGEIFAQRVKPDVFGWDEEIVAGGFFPLPVVRPTLTQLATL